MVSTRSQITAGTGVTLRPWLPNTWNRNRNMVSNHFLDNLTPTGTGVTWRPWPPNIWNRNRNMVSTSSFNKLKIIRIPAVFCIRIRIDLPLLEPGSDPGLQYRYGRDRSELTNKRLSASCIQLFCLPTQIQCVLKCLYEQFYFFLKKEKVEIIKNKKNGKI